MHLRIEFCGMAFNDEGAMSRIWMMNSVNTGRSSTGKLHPYYVRPMPGSALDRQ